MSKQITGDEAEWTYPLTNDTSPWGVYGTDLGIPYFDPYSSGMFYVFGLAGDMSQLRYYRRISSYCYSSINWTRTSEWGASTLFSGFIGELSVTYNTHLGRYLMLFLDGYTINKRTALTPCGTWTGEEVVVNCLTNPDYRNCYGPYMIPEHEVIGDKHRYYTGDEVYFVISRMTEGGTLYLDECPEPWTPIFPRVDCNYVYNTFLM